VDKIGTIQAKKSAKLNHHVIALEVKKKVEDR